MRNNFKPITIIIALIIIISSCGKGGSYSPLTSSDSQWNFLGTDHKGYPTAFDGGALESSSTNSAYVLAINFGAIPAAGTYVVANGVNGNGSCALMATINNADYLSEQGGTVTVTISNGKVTAVFSNIRMKLIDGTTEALISGKLVEQ